MLRIEKRGQAAKAWPRPEGMSPAMHQLLLARGFSDAAQAQAFLHPDGEVFADPLALKNMELAAERIERAVRRGETIAVWGDYDVDGVTATAILLKTLERMGGKARHHLPLREREGYGLNSRGVRDLAGEASLLVTVDCGINAFEPIETARSLGMDVIVTDHHRPDDELPRALCVNPLLGDPPHGNLCGAGVAWKLALALIGKEADDLVDLAAVGTVADLVPLTGENRLIVRRGLAAMNAGLRPGLKALWKAAGGKGEITAQSIGFTLGPRINAAGRLGDAENALRLLISDDPAQAEPLAGFLDGENRRRQQLEKAIIADADAAMADFDWTGRRSVVLAGESWHPGVIGLAASHVAQRACLPTVLLARMGDFYTGSCRSVPGVDMYRAVSRTRGLLERFGGHAQAAGLTLPAENLESFRAAFDESVREGADETCFIPAAQYDVELALSQVDEELIRQLRRMEPTGIGNPPPVFRSDVRIEEARAVGADRSHLRMTVSQNDASLGGIWFRHGDQERELPGTTRPVLYTPDLNAYAGRISVQLQVAQVGGPVGLRTDESAESGLLWQFLTSALYNRPGLAVGERADAVSRLAERFRAGSRGAIGVATTLAGMRSAMERLREMGLEGAYDVFEGQWPSDGRAFNALALLPVGPKPGAYRFAACLDAPAALIGGDLSGDMTAGWLSGLPDRGGLRDFYAAARALLRACGGRMRERDLIPRAQERCGLSRAGCAAALAALDSMELLSRQEGRIALLTMRRQEPEDDALFCAIQSYRAWGRLS